MCNTGICVSPLSVHAAWILDKLFSTPVKWLASGETQQRSGYDVRRDVTPDVIQPLFLQLCFTIVFFGEGGLSEDK